MIRKSFTVAQLALAGAIVGVAVANLVASFLGIDGPHQEVGAVVGGLLTTTLVKVNHLA